MNYIIMIIQGHCHLILVLKRRVNSFLPPPPNKKIALYLATATATATATASATTTNLTTATITDLATSTQPLSYTSDLRSESLSLNID